MKAVREEEVKLYGGGGRISETGTFKHLSKHCSPDVVVDSTVEMDHT